MSAGHGGGARHRVYREEKPREVMIRVGQQSTQSPAVTGLEVERVGARLPERAVTTLRESTASKRELPWEHKKPVDHMVAYF